MTFFIVNIIGLILIGIIVWWFFIAKPKSQSSQGEVIDIIVKEGIYAPSLITAKAGETLQLRFLRKDETPCAEYVIFDRLNMSEQLPLNQPHLITIQLPQSGEVEYTCQMNMYRGKIVISPE